MTLIARELASGVFDTMPAGHDTDDDRCYIRVNGHRLGPPVWPSEAEQIIHWLTAVQRLAEPADESQRAYTGCQ